VLPGEASSARWETTGVTPSLMPSTECVKKDCQLSRKAIAMKMGSFSQTVKEARCCLKSCEITLLRCRPKEEPRDVSVFPVVPSKGTNAFALCGELDTLADARRSSRDKDRRTSMSDEMTVNRSRVE